VLSGTSFYKVPIVLLGHVRLVVLGQMGLLPETLATQRTGKGLLSRMSSYMDIHGVLVLESLRADGAVVQGSLLPLGTARRGGRTAAGIGRRTIAAATGTSAGRGAATTTSSYQGIGPTTLVVIGHIGIVVIATAALVGLLGLGDSTSCSGPYMAAGGGDHHR